MGDKDKALELALTQIEKQFGKGSIMKLGQAESLKGVDVISTGSISLDSCLGVGGVPRGRIVEIYGPEASGKTSLTLHIIAEAQKAGGVAVTSVVISLLQPVSIFVAIAVYEPIACWGGKLNAEPVPFTETPVKSPSCNNSYTTPTSELVIRTIPPSPPAQ